MFIVKFLFCAVMVAACSARHLGGNQLYCWALEKEEALEESQPARATTSARTRREVHGSAVLNSDGTSSSNVMVPLFTDAENTLSAIGATKFNEKKEITSATAGLAFDNVNGYGLAVTRSKFPDMVRQDTAAGHMNLFKNENHKVDANAFVAKTTLDHPEQPNFYTYGGGLGYSYKRVGVDASVAHTPVFQKTDFSANGKVNLFKKHDTSMDLNLGASKSWSPFIPKSSWIPSIFLSFTKHF